MSITRRTIAKSLAVSPLAAAMLHTREGAWLSARAQDAPIVIGSKNFTEQALLGEIIAEHVERRLHVPVGRKFNLGGTLLALQIGSAPRQLFLGNAQLRGQGIGIRLSIA